MHAMRKSACRWYEAAAQTPCEVIRCTEDLDTKLVSPDMFEEYAVPALKEYAEICHSHGKLFVIHMCGPIRDFLPHLTEVGVDAIHCLTTPDAFGNTSVTEARQILADHAAPMFRVPAAALLHGDTGALDTFVDGLLEGIGDWRNAMIIIPCGRAHPNAVRHVIERVHERGRWQ
jgi:uroporphyrinogen-III decarboxylase